MPTAYRPALPERRFAGLALTVLVHAALLLGWQASRHALAPDARPEPKRTRIQWIRLPMPTPTPMPVPAPVSAPKPAQAPALPARAATLTAHYPPLTRPAATAPATPVMSAPAATAAAPNDAAPASAPTTAPGAPSAADILQRARRDIGAIDRSLRKENNPYIVAPADSPQIRMRRGMETAHELAPPRLWEAPKIEALVNNTGDGARRERIITGNGTYCITERASNTSIDMIEKHGKLRITNCPQHETPASRQEWRTARD
jgi:hypothetical protein